MGEAKAPYRCGVCREEGHNRRTCELEENERELLEQKSLLDWVVDQLSDLREQVVELRGERSEDKAIIKAQQARLKQAEERERQREKERHRYLRHIDHLKRENKRLRARHAAFACFSDDTRR